jgi:hypothetical protein
LTNVKTIRYAWENCTELVCITSMTAPTTSVRNAFKNTPKLVAPDPDEQAAHFTDSGTDWVNPNPCP